MEVPLEDDSDDEEMKAAFFTSLEAQHGGPLTYEQLKHWEAAIDDAEETEEEAEQLGTPPSSSPATPRASFDATRSALPQGGWLTPSTPNLEAAPLGGSLPPAPPAPAREEQQKQEDEEDAEDGEGSSEGGGPRPALHPAWCAEELDCVVTESLTSRCCSRLEEAAGGATEPSRSSAEAPATPPMQRVLLAGS